MEHAALSAESMTGMSAMPPMLSNATLLPDAADPDCGTVLLTSGGTWIGHVGPGLLFLLWGIWWTVNIFLAKFRQTASGQASCCSSYYPSPWRHARHPLWLRHWEAITMVWGPFFMVWLELKGDHQSYTNMLCNNGRFDPRHLHNWQHAASYPAFFVSGMVNLLGNFISLPQGTQHSFLGLAFSIEGAIMLMHTKHHPLDAVTHWLLGMTMLSSAAFVFLEAKSRHNLLLSTVKAGSLMLTGCWLCVMGKMLFTDVMLTTWSQNNMASSMMAPAVFAMLLLAVAVFQLILFIAMQALFKHLGNGKFTYASIPTAIVTGSPNTTQSSKLDAAALTQHELDSSAMDDSANERSESGSEASSNHTGHGNTTAHQPASHSTSASCSPDRHPIAVRDVLAKLAKPVKGSLGNGPHSKQKADHIV